MLLFVALENPIRLVGGTRSSKEQLHLPPGYSLERSDPDVLVLRCSHGTAVAHFSARGVTWKAVEATAWEDYECAGEEQYP